VRQSVAFVAASLSKVDNQDYYHLRQDTNCWITFCVGKIREGKGTGASVAMDVNVDADVHGTYVDVRFRYFQDSVC
jgi:hypothetical protein